jgi:hypothetical protein
MTCAIRQKAGELTRNPNLAADGRAEKNAGKVKTLSAGLKRLLESKRITIELERRERHRRRCSCADVREKVR